MTEHERCPECGHALVGDGGGQCAVEGCLCEADRPLGHTSPSPESCPSKCGFDKARNYAKFLLCGDRRHTSPSPQSRCTCEDSYEIGSGIRCSLHEGAMKPPDAGPPKRKLCVECRTKHARKGDDFCSDACEVDYREESDQLYREIMED